MQYNPSRRLECTGKSKVADAQQKQRLHRQRLLWAARSAGMLSGQAVNAARGTKEKQLPSSGLSFVPPLLK
eukprot:scaffold32493_cov13-Tisochrysis_lutea.AAC.1